MKVRLDTETAPESGGHDPALLEEVIRFFDRPETVVVLDATLGGGGHAEAILRRIASVREYVGFDRDGEAIERVRERLIPFADKVRLIHAPYAEMDNAGLAAGSVDALLMDLGISSFQLGDEKRGFSFMKMGPLDMRMDNRRGVTGADLVGSLGTPELTRLFREYGEERFAAPIAKAIVRERQKSAIVDTVRLADIIAKAIPAKAAARRSSHPATKVFQALRIAVNDEIDPLGRVLDKAIDMLRPGGRIGVITFHSLEDRIVKRTFVDNERRCICPKSAPVCTCGEPGRVKRLTKRPLIPSEDELHTNPRVRSAKLRVAERLAA